MKTIFNVLCLCFILSQVFAQASGQLEAFNKYKACFPLYDYPFIFSQDYRKTTKIDTYAGVIPEHLLKQFVYNKGIHPTAYACGLEWFYSYNSYIQFPSAYNFYLLVITADIKPPCGDVTYMVSYDHKGELVDTLLVYAEGYLTLPTEDNKSGESFTVESIITNDSIYIERKEEVGKLYKIGERKREYRQLTFIYTYKLNSNGKFIRIREKQKDEIVQFELK